MIHQLRIYKIFEDTKDASTGVIPAKARIYVRYGSGLRRDDGNCWFLRCGELLD
jgi:hypothetical protein